MSENGAQFVGVDWSGAGPPAAQRRAIWTAVVRGGVLCDLTTGRSRVEATEHVIALAADGPETVVGLDFAFSLPRWWLEEEGFASADRVWAWAAEQAAGDPLGWLKQLPPPFWGTRFRFKPTDIFDVARGEFRRTELEAKAPGATPMSTFRLFGPGTVGAQGLRGQPCLLALRDAGFAIWPFEPARERLVVEVFPRILVRQLSPGMGDLSGDALRTAFIDAAPAGLTGEGEYADLLRANQDAFDAAVSAWALWFGRRELGALISLEPDDAYRMEGRIWSLSVGTPSPLVAPGPDAAALGADDGTADGLAAIEASLAARGHHLIVVRPTETGPFVAIAVPHTDPAGVAPYATGESALEAAGRAFEELSG